MRQTFLIGEIVDLVLLEVADAPQLAGWMNDAEVTQYLSRGDTPMTLAAEEEWIEGLYKRPNDLTLGIWHRADQKLIGSTGLHQINQRDRNASFGIAIGEKEYWGNGIGSDTLSTLLRFAFNTKDLRAVTLDVLADNDRAKSCYEKCGFVQVGTLSEWIYKNGVWIDLDIMVARRP